MQTYILMAVLLCFFTDRVFCDYQWDYFTYSQQWPPGTCAEASREGHKCVIPQEVNTWTVHGLWPSVFGSRVPDNCNSSWKFDLDKVATIRADLDTYWPNLFNDTAIESFWSHEWSKHGTCSTDLPATADELKYFTRGLMLNRQFDISRILANAGIIPSLTATYSFKDFMSAVTKSVGFPPVLQCDVATMKNGTKLHMIGQVEICLDKTFKPRTCYSKDVKEDKSGGDVTKDALWKRRTPYVSNSITLEKKRQEQNKDTLYFKSHTKRRHSHAGPQSDCPTKYDFYYPPIEHQSNFLEIMQGSR